MFNSAHLVENIRCSHASATEPDLHRDYEGHETAHAGGQKKALGIAGRNDKTQRRYSGLLASVKT